MIKYRKATINDIDELAKIRSIFLMEVTSCSEEERAKSEIAGKIYFGTALADESFVAWLALDGDKVISTSGLSFYVVPPGFDNIYNKMAYISNMFTFPEYRKQGIGTEIFSRIVEEAKTLGYKNIRLFATDIGRPLYAKYGFKDKHGEMSYKIE